MTLTAYELVFPCDETANGDTQGIVLVDNGVPLPLSVETFASAEEATAFCVWMEARRGDTSNLKILREELDQFTLFEKWAQAQRLDLGELGDVGHMRAAINQWEEPRDDAA